MAELRAPAKEQDNGAAPPAPPRERPATLPGPPPERKPKRPRKRISPWRILRWVLAALVVWVVLSGVLFMVSAQIQRGDLKDEVGPQLSDGPYPLTGANTILVLGSDARSGDLAEPGSGGPSRSDSIMLLRIGGGANASLSIPRDTVVDIPGHGTNKINAAYALRRPRARDPDRQAVPRRRDQPRRRGQLRELPRADRRARRRHLQGRRRPVEDQRRQRATAATRSACPRARRRSTASRRSRSPARARTCATRPRTT